MAQRGPVDRVSQFSQAALTTTQHLPFYTHGYWRFNDKGKAFTVHTSAPPLAPTPLPPHLWSSSLSTSKSDSGLPLCSPYSHWEQKAALAQLSTSDVFQSLHRGEERKADIVEQGMNKRTTIITQYHNNHAPQACTHAYACSTQTHTHARTLDTHITHTTHLYTPTHPHTTHLHTHQYLPYTAAWQLAPFVLAVAWMPPSLALDFPFSQAKGGGPRSYRPGSSLRPRAPQGRY